MNWHIHWHRPVSGVRPPYAIGNGVAVGTRFYECRCGSEQARDAMLTRDNGEDNPPWPEGYEPPSAGLWPSEERTRHELV